MYFKIELKYVDVYYKRNAFNSTIEVLKLNNNKVK